MAETITIEQQAKELLAAGWTRKSGYIWLAPSGAWYLGPHGAWKVMRGIDANGKELGSVLNASRESKKGVGRG